MAHPTSTKLGTASGVYIPVVLNILSILMFLRFGSILGNIGLLGFLGLLFIAYLVNLATALSLSAIASNGEVKGGGAYYLISRSLGPEFGGSIGILFYLSQVLNTSLNIVGLVDCLRLNHPEMLPAGYWMNYGIQSCAMVGCTILCLAGSAMFARASNGLLCVLLISTASILLTAIARSPYDDIDSGIHFTGLSLATLRGNLLPATNGSGAISADSFRRMFGVLFPATSGIFAGASMSGDLRNPSKSIPIGTLWAMFSTLLLYLFVIMSMASSTTKDSFLHNTNIIYETNIWPPAILAGECATTFFSALMGLMGAAKLLQALARDKLLPGLSVFGKGAKRSDDPIFAVLVTYSIAQLALFAELNQIATLIAMGYQMTFFVMNLACFLLKIGSAPNFRPAFKFFSWQTAFVGSILSGSAMFFIDETYAASAICLLIFLFLLIHYLSPPKHWGDVSQNLIYHQVRKYLLRLKPEHIKFWRPQIILLVNDPRRHTRLIQFCNSMKKGSLYLLGHVIVTDNFDSGIREAKLQQSAWTQYISEYSRIKAFVQLNMSPSIEWGVRNLILSAGLGGMRPNIAVLGFYNMDELRRARPDLKLSAASTSCEMAGSRTTSGPEKPRRRPRGDTTARLLENVLPTDAIRTESMISPTSYMTILEDLALRNRLNVAIGKGFQGLETPRRDGTNVKRYIDLWPIQMSAEIVAGDKNFLTTNFDTYTLILQLGYILRSVPTWKHAYDLRVLVFVEYETEVEEERIRLKTLLDKLRIDADVLVYTLASGRLATYETIINGTCTDANAERLVAEVLKDDDWWQELRRLRGQVPSNTQIVPTLTFEEMLDINRRRNSSPRMGSDVSGERGTGQDDHLELPKNPTVSALSRLGVNLGIHTHQLGATTADRQFTMIDNFDGSGDSHDEDDSSDTDGADADFNDESSIPGLEEPELQLARTNPIRRRFSIAAGSRRTGAPAQAPLLQTQSRITRRGRASSESQGYGTIASSTTNRRGRMAEARSRSFRPLEDIQDDTEGHDSQDMDSRIRQAMRAIRGAQATQATQATQADTTTAPKPPTARPTLSRHSSNFTSKPTPLTKVTAEDNGQPTISFAEVDAKLENTATESSQRRPQRPILSRASSAANFSSGIVPEMVTLEGAGEDLTRLGFGHSASTSQPPTKACTTPRRTPAHSRKNSAMMTHQELLEARGSEGGAQASVSRPLDSLGEQHSGEALAGELADEELDLDDDYIADESLGSSYSTQSLPLSFNDLPSSAQHLVLNELMRRESRDAAVLFTTLPIPEEGTCKDDQASLKYLSDIEVLCDGLPPVLLVLSNNMTVTVSL